METFDRYRARVNLRQSKTHLVRPEYVHLDGEVMEFKVGWEVGEDHSLYPGEVAMIPESDQPLPWIASGDLVELEKI